MREDSMVRNEQVMEILVEKIFRSPHQPRHHFDEEKLKELAESIRANRLLQPIVVRMLDGEAGTYELIAGERRLRAHKILEREKIPAIVQDITEEEARNLILIENLQREDLTPIEEAECVGALAKQFRGNLQAVADKLGKSMTYVSDRIAILELPREAQHMLDEKKINFAQAKVILELEGDKARMDAAKLAVKLNLSANQLRGRLQRSLKGKETKAGAKGEQSGVIKFNQLSVTVVRLYDALEKFDFDMLRDAKKRDTLLKQMGILQKSLARTHEQLSKPVENEEVEPSKPRLARTR